MRIESSFTSWHRDVLGMRKTDKNLHLEDAVHGAACALDRFLKCVHRTDDVLLKWVRYENMIVFRVAVIRTNSGEVIYSVMDMAAATRLIACGAIWRRTPRGGLL